MSPAVARTSPALAGRRRNTTAFLLHAAAPRAQIQRPHEPPRPSGRASSPAGWTSWPRGSRGAACFPETRVRIRNSLYRQLVSPSPPAEAGRPRQAGPEAGDGGPVLENSQEPCIKGVQRPQERGENSRRPTQTLGSPWAAGHSLHVAQLPPSPLQDPRPRGSLACKTQVPKCFSSTEREREREREIERDRRESASLLALRRRAPASAQTCFNHRLLGSFVPGSSHLNVLIRLGPDSYPSGLSQCGERVGTPAGCGRGPGGLQGLVRREGAAGVPRGRGEGAERRARGNPEPGDGAAGSGRPSRAARRRDQREGSAQGRRWARAAGRSGRSGRRLGAESEGRPPRPRRIRPHWGAELC
ncbi:uncharacterized protein LOC116575951 [Mustela erminea]|uniref:uncharacterized protein LOC116575951 n=1 Tax=Mustela erminea TaxID=36723 RepID=UPI001386FB07|nr:uncharacterized protein LOC116575951 [Mustela erminea]